MNVNLSNKVNITLPECFIVNDYSSDINICLFSLAAGILLVLTHFLLFDKKEENIDEDEKLTINTDNKPTINHTTININTVRNKVENFDEYIINNELTLIGGSRAGNYTGFLLKPYNVLFDFGLDSDKNINIGFLTHHHSDHTQNLPTIFTRNKKRQKKIYAPKSSISTLMKYQRSHYELCYPGSLEYYSDDEFLDFRNLTYIPVCSGTTITEDELNNYTDNIHIPYDVEILEAHHSVTSVGYGFIKNTKVLKQTYKDMLTGDKKQNGSILTKFKDEGIEITEIQKTPAFVFFCDSDINNLKKHDEWKKYPVIVCECTGLKSNNEKIYLDRQHTCMSQLKPIMEEHKDKKWILIHASMCLSETEIDEIEKSLVDEKFNVSIAR